MHRALARRYGHAKGVPTRLNLYVLARELKEQGGVIRRVPAASVPHIRRCIDAGLLESSGERVGNGWAWRLTPKGEAAVGTIAANDNA